MPLRWYNLPRFNNRTHRELLVVDGAVGFIGGAGVADHWYKSRRETGAWRDTMFRVEGQAVAGLQSLFAENWLESSGELLADRTLLPRNARRRAARPRWSSTARPHGPVDPGAHALPDADRSRLPQHPPHDSLLPAGPQRPPGAGRRAWSNAESK